MIKIQFDLQFTYNSEYYFSDYFSPRGLSNQGYELGHSVIQADI